MKFFEIIAASDEAGDARLFVKFPFEARENFKATFASACRWHAQDKLWSVAPTARERLEEWGELVRGIAPASAEATRAHLTEQETERTRADLAAAAERLAALAAARGDLAALKTTLGRSRQLLELRRDEIKALEAELAFDKQQEIDEKANVEEVLGAILDLPELRAAAAKMLIFEKSPTRRDSADWLAAQLHIVNARNALANAGLELEAVSYLADYRQPARMMPPGAWWSLTRAKA